MSAGFFGAIRRAIRIAGERVWDAVYIDPSDICGDKRAAIWARFTLSSIEWQWTIWGKRSMSEAIAASLDDADEREGSLAAAALIIAAVDGDGALLPGLISRAGGSAWMRRYMDAWALIRAGGSRGNEAAYARCAALLEASADAYDISEPRGRELALAWLDEAKRALRREYGAGGDEAPVEPLAERLFSPRECAA